MDFVCPRCKGDLVRAEESYGCLPCERVYPVICAIPDFRLTPDPYIGLAEDRDKGRLLSEAGRSRSFEELLRYYYAITPEDPPDLARRWIARSLAELGIAQFTFDTYNPVGERFLDVGCSTGPMLAAAASRCKSVTGVDVAFRWLIVGAARLRELGVKANLVCANAEHLPFQQEQFDAVTAIDLLEHVPDAQMAVTEAFRVSRPGARNLFRTNNRFTPMPEPHVHLWGVGMLPQTWQARYVAARRKDLHSYRIYLQSAWGLDRLCRAAGYRSVTTTSAKLNAPQIQSPLTQQLISTYNAGTNWPVIGGLLKLAGPLLVSVAER